MTSLFAALVPVVALVYSAVGLGGGSGYLALGSLLGLGAAALRPQALALNLVVAGIAVAFHWKARSLRARLAVPPLLASLPTAYLAARFTAHGRGIEIWTGAALLLAGAVAFLPLGSRDAAPAVGGPASMGWTLAAGTTVGAIAGATGMGGGILLAPVLLFARLSDERGTAATTALFVWGNSAAALLALWRHGAAPTPPSWLLLAALGGVCGSWIGAHGLARRGLRRWLGVLLLAAGLRPLLS